MCVSRVYVRVLIFHVKDVFIIVLFQSVLLTVIGVILIAVRLPLDDSAGDENAIGFSPPHQTNCQENEEERERKDGRGRERKRGEQERDRPSISTGAGTAFIRSTIGKRETLTGLNFSLIIMTPLSHHPTSHHWSLHHHETPPAECTHALLSCFLVFFVPSASGVSCWVFVLAYITPFSHNPLGIEPSVLWKMFLSGMPVISLLLLVK